MTTEPSNGSASDDQRCYIERLQRIETAALDIVRTGLTWITPAQFKELRAALEANR